MTPKVQVLSCDPASISFPGSSESTEPPRVTCPSTLDALKLAVHRLVGLEDVVGFPTETVYGLGANALSPSAVSKIFSTKGRPQDNPLIAHVSSLRMLHRLLPKDFELPPVYKALIQFFWPGALTLLFPANPSVVPNIVTAGRPTVAVRMPIHPVARALITLADVPLAAPSANASGSPSPTRAEHVLRSLGERGLRLILDGGACSVGVESTVVDGLAPDGHLRVLRPGGVTVEELEQIMHTLPNGNQPRVLVHRRDYKDDEIEHAPTTPGMKYRHYSPSVPVILLMTTSDPPPGQKRLSFGEALEHISATCSGRKESGSKKIGLLAPSDSWLLQYPGENPPIRHFPLGSHSDPATSASRLFDGLLTLEAEGADVILVEELPETYEGLAFMNRARKAASQLLYLYNKV